MSFLITFKQINAVLNNFRIFDNPSESGIKAALLDLNTLLALHKRSLMRLD